MFTENVEKTVGMTMAELGTLKDQDKDKFYDYFNRILFQRFKIRITSRLEVYNVRLPIFFYYNSIEDESRIKWSVTSLEKVDEKAAVEQMAKSIEEMKK